jgi:hypothetical protein
MVMGGGRYTVTVRKGSEVKRERYDDVREALREIERRGRALEEAPEVPSVGGSLLRRIEPAQQVAARVELAGPGRLRVGIDVRGDGSTEGFTGRLRRRVIEQRGGETPYDALRRVVEER